MTTCLKPLRSLFLLFCLALLCCGSSLAQDQVAETKPARPINVIIGTHLRKFDMATISFQAQAGIQKIFHRRQLFLIYVDSIAEAAVRIEKLMAKKNARIRHLWFDSHGHIGRRVAMFEVGKDEVNYQTIHEPHISGALQRIGKFCDSSTIVSIGACYSASTITLPAIDSFPAQRMNGDSLLQHVSSTMNDVTVYGSSSWVMTKPFIFGGGYALAGGPSAIRFQDTLLLPLWETLGEWMAYEGKTGSFKSIPTVAMDGRGTIYLKKKTYLDIPSKKKQQERRIRDLQPGNFLPSWFVKYRLPKHERQ